MLPAQALRQIARELSGFSVLQIDVAGGQRSRRDERIEELLRLLTGAEAATVVNNNAAATAIVLNTVAAGKEVIVSRGQLVEIGGSFRLPEVMAAAGAKLVEVGTTNKTHLRDYQQAITERSAAILRVHPSNYKIVGFTAEVPLEELVRLGRAHGLAVIDDVGAGPLIDFSQFGFEKEPTLAESVAAGADVITASADKMIGGPQAGILLGKERWIQAIRKNPLARIVRLDKLALAALEATLVLFLDQQRALREVPTLRMLRRDLADITTQAERIAAVDPGLRARRSVRGRRGLLADGERLAAGPGLADPPGGRRGRESGSRRDCPPPAAARSAGLCAGRARARAGRSAHALGRGGSHARGGILPCLERTGVIACSTSRWAPPDTSITARRPW